MAKSYLLDLNNGAMLPKDLINGLNTFISSVKPNLLALTAGVAIIYLGYETLRRIIDPTKEGFDPMILVRIGLVFLGLSAYSFLVELLIDVPMSLLHDIVVKGVKTMTGGADMNAVFSSYSGYVSTDKEGTASLLEISTLINGIHMLVGVVGRLSVQMVIVLSLLTQSVYYMVGLVVLPFSLMIGNKNVFPSWFFSFIASKFSVTLSVMIMGILVTMPDLSVMEKGDGIGGMGVEILNAAFHFIVQIVGVMMLLSSPSLSNKMVSSFSSSISYGELSGAFRNTFGFSPTQPIQMLRELMSKK